MGAVLGFLLMFSVAVTSAGRLVASTLLFAGLGPVFLTRAWVDRSRRWFLGGLVCGGAALTLAGIVFARAPNGADGPTGKVSANYGGTTVHFSRFTPGNLVPEVDQLMACYTVMSAVDRLFTLRQASELKSFTKQVYAEMEADPDFSQLGSAMPLVYDEMLLRSPAVGHTFVYVPPGLDRTKAAPVFVFFHGSGGNFKAYLWVLSAVADRLKMVLVAPSFGAGNWQLRETEAAFDVAMQAASKRVKIAADNVHVAGLSNGGLAVSQLGSVRGLQLRSVIFVSPVFDGERIGSSDFALQCRARPMLVLTGREDDRVPLGYVSSAVGVLVGAGALPTLEVVPAANHFLLFSHRERVVGTLVDWLSHHGVSEQ